MKTQRLDKTIASGLNITRSDAVKQIRNGYISVNGEQIKKPEAHVDPEADIILAGGKSIKYEQFIYIMMNKPAGVLSASTDDRDETVIDLLPEELKRRGLFPAGRLDKDTVGLLLITDDGVLAHNILSPKKHVTKVYFARVEGAVDQSDKEGFLKGVVLEDGYECMPAELDIIKSGEFSEITLKIKEGKYHQVKRMFEVRGKTVIYLRRIKMGGLSLDESLEEGECRKLSDDELKLLFLPQ